MPTHFGIPPKEWECWESELVHFHNFESIPSTKGHGERSPTFSCCNHEWSLKIYPGGEAHGENLKDGMIGIRLMLRPGTDLSISARFNFLIRDSSGKVVVEKMSPRSSVFGKTDKWGWSNFVTREKIIDSSNNVLNNGTLTVEVRIKPDDEYCCLNFIPKNDFARNMLQSFMDESTSDVTFEVKDRGESATSDLFHAHKVVMQFCAKGSTLASFCEDYDKATPVPIIGIAPEVFRKMLYYIYGGIITAVEWKEKSKDFIDVADLYGIKNLKIEAEAWYVKHIEISVDNVIDELIYADEKNCFLLKEAATNFILENGRAVLETDSFQNFPKSEGIIREIISIVTMNQQHGSKKDPKDLTKLSINELRTKLYYGGGDFDGSRKRLIAQLESKNKKLKTSEGDRSQE